MSTRNALHATPHPPEGSQPAGSGSALLGWLLLCFAVIPLTMAAHGDGPGYLVGGLVMTAAGCALIAVARLSRRR